MLSKAKMVMKQALQSTRTGTAIIYERKRTKNSITKVMDEKEEIVYKNIPCKLSFKTSLVNDDGQTNSSSNIMILFVNPEIFIKEGSKIEILQEGANYTLELSSKVKSYFTHNEYQVVEFKEYI